VNKKLLFVSFFAAASAAFALGQLGDKAWSQPAAVAPTQQPPVTRGAFAHLNSDIPVDQRVIWGRLDNGMRYAIVRNPKPANGAVVRFRIGAGSMMEADDQQGLAHFLEHMAFNGSQNVPEGEMVRALERLGMAFGPHTNAYTSFDETVYKLDLPNVRDETLNEVFLVMRETANRLNIAPAAVDRERGVVLAEARGRKGPADDQLRARLNFFAPDMLLRRRLPIGLDSVIQNAPAQRLRDFYETWYRPDNAEFVFVGDIDPALIEARIKAAFGDWRPSRSQPAPINRGSPRPRGLETLNHVSADVPASILIGISYPTLGRKDSQETRKINVLHSLWQAVLNRRLERISRGANAPYQAAGAGYSDDGKSSRGPSVSVTMPADGWERALGSVEQEIRRIRQYGVQASELQQELAELETAYKNAAEGVGSEWSVELADGIIGSLGEDDVYSDSKKDYEAFLAVKPSITVEAVNAMMSEAWGQAEPQIMITTPTALPEGAIARAWATSSQIAVNAPVVASSSGFAYQDFGAPGRVRSTRVVRDLDMTQVRFANGVTLNVKSTDFENDVVYVRASFGGGGLDIGRAGKPALSLVATWAYIQGGLGQHSLEDIERIYAGRSWGVDLDIDEDEYDLEASTKRIDLDAQLNVMAAYLKDPAFRPEALERYQTWVRQYYRTYDTTPGGAFGAKAPQILRSGDPRWGLPPMEQVLALSTDDIRTAIIQQVTRSPLEVTVVGDVSVEDAIKAVSRTFGALPQRESRTPSYSAERRIRFPAGNGATPAMIVHRGDASRALLGVYWPTIGRTPSTRRETRAIALLAQIMELKLTERVREADGATYSPSAASSASSVFPGYGSISASMELKPEDVEKYRAVIDEIASSMARGEMTADELDRARKPIIENLDQNLESNAYWLSVIEDARRRPSSLDDHRTIRRDYEAITLAEVKAAASRYLRSDRAFRIVSGPQQSAAPAVATPASPAR
jgi:zinc protease